MAERDVVVAVRLEFGQQPDFVIYRNSTGVATVKERGVERVFRYGLCTGSSDLIGMAPPGLFLAVECKDGKNKLSAEQLRFLELVFNMGGVACLTRSREEAREQIRGIRNGQRKFY